MQRSNFVKRMGDLCSFNANYVDFTFLVITQKYTMLNRSFQHVLLNEQEERDLWWRFNSKDEEIKNE